MENIIIIPKKNIDFIAERDDHPSRYAIRSATEDGLLHGYTMKTQNGDYQAEALPVSGIFNFRGVFVIPRNIYTESEYYQIKDMVNSMTVVVLIPRSENSYIILRDSITCEIIDAPKFFVPNARIYHDIRFLGYSKWPMDIYEGKVQTDGDILD